jgi:CubicO group peptidase (beta-lactamase class C family)
MPVRSALRFQSAGGALASALALTTAALLPQSLSAAEINPACLHAAAEYSAEHKGTALLVIRGGKTIFEEYENGASRSTPMKIYSGTKAFWNVAALAAQEDGVLSLDEPAAATVQDWTGDPNKERITLRQLLTFTAGVPETYSLHNDGWADRDAHALKQPVVAQPGSSFIYGPAALQIFHEVLRRKLAARGETTTRYLERRVLKPLGLGPQRYLADKAGNPLLATGFVMTASQWAHMGRLILAGGKPILGSSFSPTTQGTKVNPMFALGFWNNRLATSPHAREVDPEEQLERKWNQQDWHGTCLCRSAPSDLIACIGSGGQRLYVVPSMALIVVRQGFIAKFSDGAFLRLLLGQA